MAKKQTDRLRIENVRDQGPKEIFGANAQIHDKSVNSFSKVVFNDNVEDKLNELLNNL